jgi:hypothetical protein
MTYAPRSASELDTYKRVIVVLYFALLATVPMATDPGVIKLVLLAVGAGTAAVVLFIRFSLIPPILHTPTMALRERLGRLRAFYIICFALSEAVALYGLVSAPAWTSQFPSLPSPSACSCSVIQRRPRRFPAGPRTEPCQRLRPNIPGSN